MLWWEVLDRRRGFSKLPGSWIKFTFNRKRNMPIRANKEKATISGEGYEIGMSLYNTFKCLFEALGEEPAKKLIHEAINLASNSD